MPLPPNGEKGGFDGLNDVNSVAPTPTTTSHAAQDEYPQPLPEGPRRASHPACSGLDLSASKCRRSTITIHTTDHTICDGANQPSAAGHTPNTRPWAHDLRGAEPLPAQLLSEGDEDHARSDDARHISLAQHATTPSSSFTSFKRSGDIGLRKDPKLLWAKALWWATQEASRRRAQKLAEEKSTPDGRLSGVRLRNAIVLAKKLLQPSPRHSTDVSLEFGHVAGEVGGGVVGGGGIFRRVARIARMFGRAPAQLVSPEPEPASGAGVAAAACPSVMSGTDDDIYASCSHSVHRHGSISETPDLTALGSPGRKQGALALAVRVESVWEGNFARLLHSKVYIIVTMLCTLWALLGEDIYLLQGPPVSLDRNIYSIFVVCVVLFLVDLMLRGKYEAGYWLSFWFWLDVIALVSLLPEVIWVVAEIDVFNSGAAGLARSGRAASAGTRVVRILRIMKLLKQLYELKKSNIRTDRNQLGDNSTSELSRKLEDYVTVSDVRRSMFAHQ
jgi:hypothetical protein